MNLSPDSSPIIKYKRKLMSSIINSPDLISLINSDCIDENGNCIGVDDKLIYKQIFPFYYVPETQTDHLSYITMKVDGLGDTQKLYTKVEVYIYVIASQKIMRVDEGDGTRIDMMGNIIEHLFNGRDDFGFGEMKLLYNIEGSVTNIHRCRTLRFIVEDFNSNACKK